MKYLFMYDISENRILIKVSNILKKKGIRTQYSFFEAELTKSEMYKLYNEIVEILDERKDKFFVIPLSKQDKTEIKRIGKIPNSIKGVF